MPRYLDISLPNSSWFSTRESFLHEIVAKVTLEPRLAKSQADRPGHMDLQPLAPVSVELHCLA